MRTALCFTLAVVVAGCTSSTPPQPPRPAAVAPVEETKPPAVDPVKPDPQSEPTVATPDNPKSPSLKPLTAEEQKELLALRLNGGMGYSFRQFANMFLVSSKLHFGTGIGLMTPDKEIAATPLQSPFPESYKPTLREFLDAIAVQTFSDWKYDPSSKYFQSDVETKGPIEGLAMFEFQKADREKPYEVTVAKDWMSTDKGNWVMYSPPQFPVGMDIYEMGTYSPSEGASDESFALQIRLSVALEWAQRVSESADKDDLKPARVGKYDALYFEAMIPSQLDKDIKWRQWVFMVDQRCYFIVSTILPELEEKIFPDVESMLASFRIKSDGPQ